MQPFGDPGNHQRQQNDEDFFLFFVHRRFVFGKVHEFDINFFQIFSKHQIIHHPDEHGRKSRGQCHIFHPLQPCQRQLRHFHDTGGEHGRAVDKHQADNIGSGKNAEQQRTLGIFVYIGLFHNHHIHRTNQQHTTHGVIEHKGQHQLNDKRKHQQHRHRRRKALEQ